MPTSSPTASTSSRARNRAGSSATASRTSSATTRSRFRTWASTPTPTCTRPCSPTRACSARTRSTTCASASASWRTPTSRRAPTRQRGQGARHQSPDRQPALLGRSEHRHHRARRASAKRATRPFINDDTTIQFVDNFSWTVGKHAFKFGGEVRRVLYDQIGGVVTRGRFGFDGRYTQNPLLPAAAARRRRVRRLPARALQPIRRAGRRADRQLPLELLRALRAGQLEGEAER